MGQVSPPKKLSTVLSNFAVVLKLTTQTYHMFVTCKILIRRGCSCQRTRELICLALQIYAVHGKVCGRERAGIHKKAGEQVAPDRLHFC